MGIESDRVRALDSGQSLSPSLGKLKESAVGPVDVEPQTFLSREVGSVEQWVDGAGVYRPRRGHEHERLASSAAILVDHRARSLEVEM